MRTHFIFLLAFFSYKSFSVETPKADTLSLDSIYTEARGTFVLYNLNRNEYQVYNEEGAKTPYPVHSTSKILWSIIGLEEGIIKDENEITVWDSTKYPRREGWPDGWANDLTIVTALNKSVNWYYQELLGKMTPEMIDTYLTKYDYQPDFKVEKIHYYGLTFNIKKTAFEQIDFLSRLYTNEFQISDSTLATIWNGLLYKKTDQYILYTKTGLGPVDDNHAIGWYIGMIEKQDEVYFFASNVVTEDELKASGFRIEYALKTLKKLGLI